MRPTDPLALSSQQWRPRGEVRKPQRVVDRQIKHGRYIQPMDTMRRDPNRLWFWTQFAIYAGCSLYALDLWVIR
jgi:hypothetical protein